MILFAIGFRDFGFPSATGNELYFSFQIHISLEIWFSASRLPLVREWVGGLVGYWCRALTAGGVGQWENMFGSCFSFMRKRRATVWQIVLQFKSLAINPQIAGC